MKKNTALSFILCLLFFIGSVSLLIYKENWLQTDLRALLPEQKGWQPIQIQADDKLDAQFNSQVIAAIGHKDPEKAFAITAQIAQSWRESALFRQVNEKVLPDLAKLRTEIQQLKLATLPAHIQDQLNQHPAQYFQQYAEQLVNPFNQSNLLPLQDDWLGFGRFTLSNMQSNQLSWNAQNGMVYTEQAGITWVLLRGELTQTTFINPDQSLTHLVAQNKLSVQAQGGNWLVTSPALFSADAKQKAEKESTLMATLGISLTLLLLLWTFRAWQVIGLFLPILMGMLSGIAAVILYFGQIHVLTLAIGTSLVGVLIDFPLHWLASSLFNRRWQSFRAMRNLKTTFFISLGVTLVGYVLLAFTALPILKQTALFSMVALIGAILTTMTILPALFSRWQSKENPALEKARSILTMLFSVRPQKSLILILVIFTLAGLYQTQWKDDIRQWVSLPDEMLQEAQQIAQISGVNLSTQYFLITAPNDEMLLEKDRQLTQLLQQRHISAQSLSQWIMSPQAQQNLIPKLTALSPKDYAVMAEIGVAPAQIQQALEALKQTPILSLQQALQTNLGQAWQNLYLGRLGDQVGAIIRLTNADGNIAQLANNQDIFWQDKRAHLNQAFQETRDQAAWLKLASFTLAGGFLCFFWGFKRSLTMLFPPMAAILLTLGIFGWFGVPIGLFSLFGLLLVSAIGVDYTAYMQAAPEPLSHKRIAILLAALTTLISFLLLSISSTPAIAAFGLAVSIGVLLSVIFTLIMHTH